MLYVVLAIAGATASGVGVERRYGARAAAAARQILRTMLYVLTPPVLFFNVAELRLTAEVGAGLVLGIAALVLTGVLAYALARHLLRLPSPTTGAVVNASIQGNTGYLGLPLVVALLGPEHLGEAILYNTFVQSPVFLLGSFGVATALGTKAGNSGGERLRAFFTRNPPLYAVVAGMLAPAALTPPALIEVSHALVYAMLPLGFLAISMVLADERRRGSLERLRPPTALAIVMRMIVAPLLLLAIAAPLVDVPTAYLILAATPVGLNSVVLAHEFGLHLRVSASAIAGTTALALPVAIGVTLI